MASDVLVVGGGITGTAVARDLALRDIDVTLVERGSLAAGTSGHNHGLIHTGARYADSDPESARDCIAERHVLDRIAPHCLTDTGGVFASLPADEPGYLDAKRAACDSCDIPVETLDGDAARELEPGLAPDVDEALWVPSATVDPFWLTAATAASAEAAGATIRIGIEVAGFEVEGGRVVDATLRRAAGGQPETVAVEHVVNAAGAWAGQVAALAGAEVEVVPVGGACTAVEPRVIDTVVHRGRPRGEGDIAVPHGSATLLGTTIQPLDDPDAVVPDPDAAAFLIDELADLVPAIAESTPVRTYAGIRPLVVDGAATDPNELTRDFRVFDHADRDGIAGLTTVVGGKLTTHRLMAERVVDQVTDRLGVDATCRTAREPLVGADDGRSVTDLLARYGIDDRIETAPW